MIETKIIIPSDMQDNDILKSEKQRDLNGRRFIHHTQSDKMLIQYTVMSHEYYNTSRATTKKTIQRDTLKTNKQIHYEQIKEQACG